MMRLGADVHEGARMHDASARAPSDDRSPADGAGGPVHGERPEASIRVPGGTPRDRELPRSHPRPADDTAARRHAVGFFAIATHEPESPTVVTMVLGGGVGITDRLEMGGQLVPFDVAPEAAFTNPSAYATYLVPISSGVDFMPFVQVVYPLESDDPFFFDVGATLTVRFGTWGEAVIGSIFSLNVRDDESGSSITLPLILMRQASEQLTVELSSGVGFSRFEPRFGLSRRTGAFEFNEVTIPAGVAVTWTVAHRARRRPLADLVLGFQWPQLYTSSPEIRGIHTQVWSIQLLAAWYFLH